LKGEDHVGILESLGLKKKAAAPVPSPAGELSVTVSIGVAEPSTRYRQPEQVIRVVDLIVGDEHSGHMDFVVQAFADTLGLDRAGENTSR
jgi:PleD family two-component response regulator